MAIKYLAGDRLIGTAAERAALTTGGADVSLTFSGNTEAGETWSFASGMSISGGQFVANTSATGFSTYDFNDSTFDAPDLSDTWVIDFDITRVSGDHMDHPQLAISSTNAAYNRYSAQGSDDRTLTLAYMANGNTGDSDSNANWNIIGYKGSSGVNTASPNDSSNPSVQSFQQIFYRVAMSVTTTRRMTCGAWTTEADRDLGFSNSTNRLFTPVEGSDTAPSDWADGNAFRYLIMENKNGNQCNWRMNDIKILDGATTIPAIVYPNLPAGTIFEQTDDYKYYMWDGSTTWTVMVAN